MIDLCTTMDAITLDQAGDLIMQQIEIILDTRPGDVLGDRRFGTDFSEYLYNTNIGNRAAAASIRSAIMSNIELFDWQLDVNVEFFLGSDNDIMLVTFILTHGDDVYTKTYKVTEGSIKPNLM